MSARCSPFNTCSSSDRREGTCARGRTPRTPSAGTPTPTPLAAHQQCCTTAAPLLLRRQRARFTLQVFTRLLPPCCTHPPHPLRPWSVRSTHLLARLRCWQVLVQPELLGLCPDIVPLLLLWPGPGCAQQAPVECEGPGSAAGAHEAIVSCVSASSTRAKVFSLTACFIGTHAT